MKILTGDCFELLQDLPANSVDSVVTDPPYGLAFMGKKWDYDVPSADIWREVLRVLKPGGHLLSFGGTRTYHRMVVAIEAAGFEIRDQIQWIYGSGFPKSMDVSKAIDKAAGAEREVVGFNSNHRTLKHTNTMVGEPHSGDGSISAPATDFAKQWQGWGTALKPANEPICMARKPLEGTVAKNFEKYGVGGLNIDASRIDTQGEKLNSHGNKGDSFSQSYKANGTKPQAMPSHSGHAQGRWPANVIFDEEAAQALDEQTKELHGAGAKRKAKRECVDTESIFGMSAGDGHRFGDSGGASRFFYVAKASKKERNAGLEGMPVKMDSSGTSGNKNHHPTVKPVKLMEYLIRLVTPEGGTVLDPFMGSGTTGVAAKNLGFEFIGCEMNEEYVEIAKRRIENAKREQREEQLDLRPETA